MKKVYAVALTVVSSLVLFSQVDALTIINGQVNSSSDDAYDVPAGWPGYSHTDSIIYAGKTSDKIIWGGWRWTNLNIPTGATITNAYVEFKQSGWGYLNPVTLAFEKSSSPATFSSSSTPNTRWSNRTTFQLNWTKPSSAPDTWIRTPDLSTGIQELVNTYGGISNLALLEDGTPSLTGEYHSWWSYNSGAGNAAKLHIEYDSGVDTTPPARTNGQPTGQFPYGTTQATLSLNTDENATCKYGTTAGTPYASLPSTFSVTGATSHSSLVTGLTDGSSYSYYVKCQDAAANANPDDFAISFSVAQDTVPPVRSNGQPTGQLPVGTTQTTFSLSTNENATCKYSGTPGVGYPSMTDTFAITGQTSHSTTITGLQDGGAYSYYVRCQDTQSNTNPDDYLISFSVAMPDLIPPARTNGQPTGQFPYGTTQATLSLNTDENATCKYGTTAGTPYASLPSTFSVTGATSHSSLVTGLTDGSSYSYYVKCQDAAANANPDDFAISFSVAQDTVPPVRSNGQPTGQLPSGTTQVTMSLATNENATCKYGGTAGTPYAAIPSSFAQTGGTSHSTTLTGLTDSTTYTRYIRCQDGLGNANTDDFVIAFSILAPGPVIQNVQVVGSSNDAYHVPAGWPGYSHTDGSIYVGKIGGSRVVWGGWRWTGLTIPANATITSAYADFTQSGWGSSFTTTLAFQDSPNAPTFSSSNSPYNRWATKTIFQQNWAWPRSTPNSWIRTPDLSAGIQELVNKHGGLSTVVLLEDGTPAASDYHTWQSYDGSPSRAAKLHVEYTLTAPPDVTPPARSNGLPTGQLPSGTAQTMLSLDTNENATCKYATVSGTAYDQMPLTFAATGTTNHETQVTGLIEGTIYHYYVRCRDTSGNTNIDDYEITFSVTSYGIGVPWKLVFSMQPTSGVTNGVLPPFQVSVQDKIGTVIASEVVPVTVALANNTEGATLLGTKTVNTVNGVAQFSDLRVSAPGNYTFVASAPIELRGRWDAGPSGKYLAVEGEGNYAYLGHVWENGGVEVINIEDPANPAFLTNWGMYAENPHEGLTIKNGIALIGSEAGTGAAMVDFTNPAFPQELSRMGAAQGAENYFHNTKYDGQYAYLVPNRGPQVYVFDVRDPANPVKIRVINSTSGGQTHDVSVVNGRLYLHDYTAGKTDIFDVSNVGISAPLLGSFYSGPATHSSWWTADYNYLIVAQEPQASGGTAGIFDVRNPANVVRVATLDPVALGFGEIWPHEPRVVDNVLYFAWNTAGLKIFEITDPADPILVGAYRTSGVTGMDINGNLDVFPHLGPDRVLASDLYEGLFVLDTAPTPTRSQSFAIQ